MSDDAKFYVYMAILEGFLENGKYKFDRHDVLIPFTWKGSMNKFFSLTKGVS